MKSLFLFASLLGVGLAQPATRASSYQPSVIIQNGTIIGNLSSGIESFFGIPYAEPPVGPRRLGRPQPLTTGFANGTRTIYATDLPTACPQPTTANFSAFANIIQGEDCLTVNVVRPSGLNSSSQLPVLFWIYGGAFEAGFTQQYDGTPIVNQSLNLDHPVIFVAVNYRVNGFGFLGGREVQEAGATNLGLRDQRLALHWVQENIGAFGGDPSKVTIFGESAGSISTFSHTIIDGGNNNQTGQSLFRGAIMNSGTVLPVEEVNCTQAQATYDQVVREAGCASANNTLDCLRNVPYQTLWDAVNTLPIFFSYSSLALPFLPRPDPTDNFYPVSPELAIEAGNYTRVPVIAGDQQDEGTLFSLAASNVTTTDLLVEYVQMFFPAANRSNIEALIATYPEDPLVGSPFGTDNSTICYPQYKRTSALLGDAAFTLRRRQYLTTVARTQPSWSFLDSHLFGQSYLGTYHSSDTEAIFDGTPIVPTDINSVAAETFRTFYISFTKFLDPNAIGIQSPLIYWPRYTSWDPVLLNLRDTGNTLIQDDFREESAQYFEQHPSAFRL